MPINNNVDLHLVNKNKESILLVGLGHIGLKHINSILKFEDSLSIYGIVEPSKKSVKFFKQQNNNSCKFFQDLTEVDLDLVDTVVLCSPSFTHYAQITYLFNKVENIICEKPIFIDPIHATKIKELVKSSESTNLIPLLQVRHSNSAKYLREKDLSNVNSIDMTMNWKRDKFYFKKNEWRGTKDGDGGLLLNQAIHYFDFLSSFFGRINNMKNDAIFTNLNNSETSDVMYGVCKFDSTPMNFNLSVSSSINHPVAINIQYANNDLLKLSGNSLDKVVDNDQLIKFENKDNNLHNSFYASYINDSISTNILNHLHLNEELAKNIE